MEKLRVGGKSCWWEKTVTRTWHTHQSTFDQGRKDLSFSLCALARGVLAWTRWRAAGAIGLRAGSTFTAVLEDAPRPVYRFNTSQHGRRRMWSVFGFILSSSCSVSIKDLPYPPHPTPPPYTPPSLCASFLQLSHRFFSFASLAASLGANEHSRDQKVLKLAT